MAAGRRMRALRKGFAAGFTKGFAAGRGEEIVSLHLVLTMELD
jgi:hypothetical protein